MFDKHPVRLFNTLLRAVLGLGWAASGHGQEAPSVAERFTVSDDGLEVRDNKSRLIWQRCVHGMAWNGRTCAGTPTELDFNQAQGLATELSKQTRQRWRLPHVPELRLLMVHQPSDGKGDLVDAAMFPGTPAAWHWTASTTVLSGGTFNQYSYANIAQNRTPGSVNRTQFLHGWAVSFGTGEAVGNIKKRSPLVLRLVRPDM